MNNFLFDKTVLKNNNFLNKVIFFVILIFAIVFSFIYFYSLARGVDKNFLLIDEKIKKIEIDQNDFKIDSASSYDFVYPKVISHKIIKSPVPNLKTENIIFPDNFSAQAILVKDQSTGKLLFAKNIYDKRAIASITKLMSVLVLLEKEIDWDEIVLVIGEDSLDTHIYAGEKYSKEDLWQASLIASSNKAILSLINSSEWNLEEFVLRMNKKAQELGMLDTFFTDPTGLSEKNISTASDLVILLNEALKNKKISSTLSKKELVLYSDLKDKEKKIWNTNWLLLGWVNNNFSIFNGGKTGYIDASLYNFAMQVGDANNNIVNVVVLGANSHEARFVEARDVANWVFDNYIWK